MLGNDILCANCIVFFLWCTFGRDEAEDLVALLGLNVFESTFAQFGANVTTQTDPKCLCCATPTPQAPEAGSNKIFRCVRDASPSPTTNDTTKSSPSTHGPNSIPSETRPPPAITPPFLRNRCAARLPSLPSCPVAPDAPKSSACDKLALHIDVEISKVDIGFICVKKAMASS